MRTRTALSLVVVAIPLLMGAGSPSPSTPPAATPEYVKEYNNGVKAQERKEYQDAVRWYQKALAVKPDYPDALNNLGFCLRSIAKGYLDEASQAYRKALALNTDHAQALEYQGELYLLEGHLLQAHENVTHLERLHAREVGDLKGKLNAILAEAKKLL